MGRTTIDVRRNGGRNTSSHHPRPAGRRGTALARYGIPAAIGAALVSALVVVFVVISGGGPSGSQVSVDGPARDGLLQQGDAVPDFSGPGLTGGRVEWNQFGGQATVLAVWAPWCPHCQAELPVLGEVAKQFPGVPVVTVETAVGQRTGPSGEGFFIQHGLHFPTAVDDQETTILRALGVSSFPTIYFVGSDGRVVGSTVGELPRSDLIARFQQLSGLGT